MQSSAPRTESENLSSLYFPPSNSFPTRVVTEGNRMMDLIAFALVGGENITSNCTGTVRNSRPSDLCQFLVSLKSLKYQ